jgi:transglutaminase-like putative cysteine protease
MRVGVRHLTRISYSAPITEEVLETRLGPLSDADQRWERFELRVRPSGMLRPYLDAFGNTGYLVTLAGMHDFIELTTDSVVTTLAESDSAPHEPVRPLTALQRHDYLSPSRLAPHHESVEELAGPYRPGTDEETFAAAQALSHAVFELLEYRPGTTDTTTTAIQALLGGVGVCQDFTHLLISACRTVGIPARYASGYLLESNDSTGQVGDRWMRLPQPGASHAWVEAFTPAQGWRGLDPTHDSLIDDRYVKMAVGRDYADVPPTRGVFRGSATSELVVEVRAQALE